MKQPARKHPLSTCVRRLVRQEGAHGGSNAAQAASATPWRAEHYEFNLGSTSSVWKRSPVGRAGIQSVASEIGARQ